MNRSGNKWMEEQEAVVSRFVTGEDDRMTFVEALGELGLSHQDVMEQIAMAEEWKAELAQVASAALFMKLREVEQ